IEFQPVHSRRDEYRRVLESGDRIGRSCRREKCRKVAWSVRLLDDLYQRISMSRSAVPGVFRTIVDRSRDARGPRIAGKRPRLVGVARLSRKIKVAVEDARDRAAAVERIGGRFGGLPDVE